MWVPVGVLLAYSRPHGLPRKHDWFVLPPDTFHAVADLGGVQGSAKSRCGRTPYL
eukprot:CAMPEP_0175831178 /NCGR_PEP_ID=MMETSP0107_2-20121207/14323_1 /TAXON_ID=195067 ORGANISM="Goniomonas pacifica, Strain CCMP1869" /NCGR_SAMPLE_ID=MMETSP0107_2 /ASSEMBLY_ACC=CAM_ASM_000203 /LENGTH=54 /DNA_ID=CAMNT_0017144193 /DNA_START=505 /DNA_END=669 /DNA_ORIENTATION=+